MSPRLRQIHVVLKSLVLSLILILGSRLARLPQSIATFESFDGDTLIGKWIGTISILSSIALCLITANQFGRLVQILFRGKMDLQKPALNLMLGLGFLSLASMMLGHLGLFHLPAFLLLVMAINIFWGFSKQAEDLTQIRFIRQGKDFLKALSNVDRMMLVVIGVYAVPKFLESFTPNGQGDPLYYHVYSAWRWVEVQNTYFDPWFPWFLQGGAFEYLFGFLGIVLHQPLALLIASQVLHAFVSMVLGSAIVYQIARVLTPKSERMLWMLAVLAYLTIPSDPLIVIRAKNDGFVGSMLLAAVFSYVQFLQSKDRRQMFVTLVFAALALTIKHTALFVLMPLMLVVGSEFIYRRDFKGLLWLVRWSLLALPFAAVILIRNFLSSGSPFFPAMTSMFPSPYVNKAIATYANSFVGSPAHFWREIGNGIQNFSFAKPFFAMGLGAIFISRGERFWFCALCILSFAMTVTFAGGNQTSYRFAIATIGLMSVCALFTTEHLARMVSSRIAYAVALAAAVYGSGIEIPLSRFGRWGMKYWMTSESVFHHVAKEREFVQLNEWINSHYKTGKILSTSTGEGLLLKVPIVHHMNEIRANRLVLESHDSDQFVRGMLESGFTLFLILKGGSPHAIELPFMGKLDSRLKLVKEFSDFQLYELSSQ